MTELIRSRRWPARLGVLQDCAHDGAQIPAHAHAIIGEYLRHARHVRRARIAGDQMLYELLADKWADVRMIEYIVERIAEILFRGLAGRHGISIQQRLSARLVM